MSQTRVKIKSKKLPNLDGYATSERLNHAPEGMTLPQAANGAGYINQPIRSECAPNNAPIGHLEKKLTPYELKKITDFLAGYLVNEGKIRICDTASGGGMPKGKRPSRDYSPLSKQESFLAGRYNLLISEMSNRVKTGLECIGEMYVNRTKITLLRFGQILARDANEKAAEGALTDFFINAAYEIERVERHFEIIDRNNGIRRNSRFPRERLSF